MKAPKQTSSGAVFIVCPVLLKGPSRHLNWQEKLEEAKGLVEAIQLNIKGIESIKQNVIRPATYLGKGQIEALKGVLKALEVNLVFIDAPLSPVQQRNLEKLWACKVIDRTGLILEIFGARAQTAEGRLQVELAALTFQRSRLVRSWTHLERQRGSFGFIGGPGETQLELDRRLIDERVDRIKKDLEEVKRTRTLHRKARRRVPYPIVALVGYTNAGKSTLFNQLTHSSVVAEHMLFATLDPTMRRLCLPSGRDIILSDTVGFISHLPTLLIAAFRATLEEVIEADLILHVRDISHPATESQNADVLKVLEELNRERVYEEYSIEILNKADLFDQAQVQPLKENALQATSPPQCVLSALTGEGIPELLEKIDQFFAQKEKIYFYTLPFSEGKKMAWLYAHGEVLSRKEDEREATLEVRLSEKNKKQFDSLN